MIQLILHLIGDFYLQPNKMAIKKTSETVYAFLHALLYTLPFALITQSVPALLVICFTHGFIDRYRLVRYIIFIKNKIIEYDLCWEDCKTTGYHKDTPVWLATTLMLITDATAHLTINYFAIKYL